MRKKAMVLLFSLLLIGITSVSFAFVLGPSNLSMFGYPESTCLKPFKPYNFTSQYDIDLYNIQVREYNDCISWYIKGCINDIKRIKEAAKKAVE